MTTLLAVVQVKLWDTAGDAPSLLASQDMGVGAVFTVGIPADAPHLIAAGGARGEVALWDLQLHNKFRRAFTKHLKAET